MPVFRISSEPRQVLSSQKVLPEKLL